MADITDIRSFFKSILKGADETAGVTEAALKALSTDFSDDMARIMDDPQISHVDDLARKVKDSKNLDTATRDYLTNPATIDAMKDRVRVTGFEKEYKHLSSTATKTGKPVDVAALAEKHGLDADNPLVELATDMEGNQKAQKAGKTISTSEKAWIKTGQAKTAVAVTGMGVLAASAAFDGAGSKKVGELAASNIPVISYIADKARGTISLVVDGIAYVSSLPAQALASTTIGALEEKGEIPLGEEGEKHRNLVKCITHLATGHVVSAGKYAFGAELSVQDINNAVAEAQSQNLSTDETVKLVFLNLKDKLEESTKENKHGLTGNAASSFADKREDLAARTKAQFDSTAENAQESVQGLFSKTFNAATNPISALGLLILKHVVDFTVKALSWIGIDLKNPFNEAAGVGDPKYDRNVTPEALKRKGGDAWTSSDQAETTQEPGRFFPNAQSPQPEPA